VQFQVQPLLTSAHIGAAALHIEPTVYELQTSWHALLYHKQFEYQAATPHWANVATPQRYPHVAPLHKQYETALQVPDAEYQLHGVRHVEDVEFHAQFW